MSIYERSDVALPGKLGLSETEYKIMRYIWDQNLDMFSARAILKGFAEQGCHWAGQTVNTYLEHLVKKNALAFRLQGHQKVYYPTMSHRLYRSFWLKKIILQNFDNGMDDLIAALDDLKEEFNLPQKQELIRHMTSQNTPE